MPGDHYIVKNHLMALPARYGNSPYVPFPETVMQDVKDHGNCVASLITGATCGVAKKARLVPIRYKNSIGAATILAVFDAWRYILDRVKSENARRESASEGSFLQKHGMIWFTERIQNRY